MEGFDDLAVRLDDFSAHFMTLTDACLKCNLSVYYSPMRAISNTQLEHSRTIRVVELNSSHLVKLVLSTLGPKSSNATLSGNG